MTLYCNGKEVGTRTAHRVFKFDVALDEGFNVLMAVADTVKDSITLEKVETEPACYTLPEFNERQGGRGQLVQADGQHGSDRSHGVPEGYYSIKDSLEELAKNEEAFAVTAKAVKLATNFDIKPGEGHVGHDEEDDP